MSDPQLTALARRVRALEKARLDSKQPNLGFSTIEDGTLTVVDAEGNLKMQIGKQFDGTTTSAVVSGPVPPTPTAPQVSGQVGNLRLYWDGGFEGGAVAPMDFARVLAYAVPAADFVSANPLNTSAKVGEFNAAAGGEITAALDPGVEYVTWFAAWSQSGQVSAPSAISGGTVGSTVGLGSDGSPPSSSPELDLVGGVGFLQARWESVLNSDPVRYGIYLTTEPDRPLDESWKVADTPANSVTIQAIAKNLLPNGNFTASPGTIPPGWRQNNVILTASDDVDPISGSVVGKMVCTDPQFTFAFMPNGVEGALVAPGRTYRLAGRLRSAQREGITGGVNVSWYDSNGNFISTDLTPIGLVIPVGSWLETARDVVAPAGAAYAAAAVGMNVPVEIGDVFYASGIELRDSAASEPLSPLTNYFVRVVAYDEDGSAAPGPQASAQVRQVTGPDVAADYVYAGEVTAAQIRSGELSADVTLSGRVKTANSGARVELDASGIQLFNSDDSQGTVLGTDGQSTFRGQVEATNLLVTEKTALHDVSIENGSDLVMASSITRAVVAPTVTSRLVTHDLGDAKWFVVPEGGTPVATEHQSLLVDGELISLIPKTNKTGMLVKQDGSSLDLLYEPNVIGIYNWNNWEGDEYAVTSMNRPSFYSEANKRYFQWFHGSSAFERIQEFEIPNMPVTSIQSFGAEDGSHYGYNELDVRWYLSNNVVYVYHVTQPAGELVHTLIDSFPTPPGTTQVQFANGRFYSLAGGRVSEHTDMASSSYDFGFTYRGGPGEETELSPIATMPVARRGAVYLSAPEPPDGATTTYYAGLSGGELREQPSQWLEEIFVSGALAPTETQWASSIPASIRSTNDEMVLSADGTMSLGNGATVFQPDGTGLVKGLNVYSTEDVDTDADNDPPLLIGDPAGLHVRMDGNEIQPMADASNPGTLFMAVKGLLSTGDLVGNGGRFRIGGSGTPFAEVAAGSYRGGTGAAGYAIVNHGMRLEPDIVLVSALEVSPPRVAFLQAKNNTTITVAIRRLDNGNLFTNISAGHFDWIAIKL